MHGEVPCCVVILQGHFKFPGAANLVLNNEILISKGCVFFETPVLDAMHGTSFMMVILYFS